LEIEDIFLIEFFNENEFDQIFQKCKVGGRVGDMDILPEIIIDLKVADQAEFDLVSEEMVDKPGKIGGSAALGGWDYSIRNFYSCIMYNVQQFNLFKMNS